MDILDFNLSSCVRVSSKLSLCTKCVDICPVNTIVLSNNIPSFVPNDCVGCGGCVGICPTESFSLGQKDHIQFFFETIEKGENVFSCKENIPCISWFSIDHLLSFSIASKENIVLDLSHCATCSIKEPLFEQIQNNIKETNIILNAIEPSKQLEVKFDSIVEDVNIDINEDEIVNNDDKSNDRRSFLRKFSLKGAVQENEKFNHEVEKTQIKEFEIQTSNISNIKEKVVPFKRKLLYSVLKNKDKNTNNTLIQSSEVTFISQKYIDNSCTNCQICYRVCPTGALSSNKKFSVIDFDPLVCVKCHLCHDVCETDSIDLMFNFDTEVFDGTKKEVLIEFDTKRCDECGNNFTYKGGELTCPRCKIEEDESYALHNISRGGLNF